MTTLLSALLIVVGFALLVKGGDWLVSGSSALARRIGMSDLAIGLTVVAFGTSMPEFVVSFLATLQGDTEIALGNVIGSNIANILLILGVSAIIYPLLAARGTVWLEIPFVLLASVVLTIQANDVFLDGASENFISRSEGIALLSFFAIFLYYVGQAIGKDPNQDIDLPHEASRMPALWVVLGLVLLVAGGHLVVQNAVAIAERLGVPQYVIGATVVAVGTSLPELATSVMAALRKNSDIAVGNIVGSNIFNILFIVGVSSVVRPQSVPESVNGDAAAMLVATLLLFGAMLVGRPKHQIQRVEGIFFVIAYVAYIAWLIQRS